MCNCHCKPTEAQLKAAERKGWTDAIDNIAAGTWVSGDDVRNYLIKERDRRFPRKLREVTWNGERFRWDTNELRVYSSGVWYRCGYHDVIDDIIPLKELKDNPYEEA